MIKKFLFLFISFCIIQGIGAQNKAVPTVVSPDAFIQIVKKYHPLAKQANLLVDKANAELMAAKGAFDPVIQMDAQRKTFDGKNYFFYTNPELKLPTPIGMDIKTGIEDNGGQFISSETTRGQSSYLGAEIALAKGLLIDKRRAALQQAKLLTGQSEQERLNAVNNLLFDAYADYWKWAGNFRLYAIYNKFVSVAADRLRLVRVGFLNGDRALMDTVEAFTQLQNFRLLQSEALLDYANASVDLSYYLWDENQKGYLVPDEWIPDTVQFALNIAPKNLNEIITQAAIQNPALRSYEYKLNMLEVERKLKFQSLLPTLNLKANILNRDPFVIKGVDAAFIQNNFKWGIDFKIPIFLREGRGEYKKAQIKIKETNLDFINKQRQVENKIRYYFNEASALSDQLFIIQDMYKNYLSLLKNEELRFAQGESSLFLINSRENKTLEALQKQVALQIKFQKARYAVEWAAGLLR
ncbi:MAG: TolC family protein [Chitinophagaceae bacterium]